MANSIMANTTNIAITEEKAGEPTVLDSPVWKYFEPNDYSDFGGEIDQVSSSPISNTRQEKRGTVTNVNASGGFGMDVRQNNLEWLMQGFLCANAHEKVKTKPLNGSPIAITGVATSGEYSAASGLGAFKVGDLVLAEGFLHAGNNGLGKVTASEATKVTTDHTTVTEASPLAGNEIKVVGFEFGEGDLTLTVTGGLAVFASSAKTMTELGLQVGEWFFCGGDASANRYAEGSGYFRVLQVTTTQIICDKATDLKVTGTHASKKIQLFFGTFQKNQPNPTNIKFRSYQLERQLGNDGNGIQSQYVKGAFPNEISFNIPAQDKFTASLNFIGLDVSTRTGTEGIASGDRVTAKGEKIFNTSSNVRRVAMSFIDDSKLDDAKLFNYIEDTTLTINNGFQPLPAVGVLGAFDVSAGNFVVSGTTNAYFTNVSSIEAIRNNADVTIDIILAKDNAGLIFDVPIAGVSDGKPNVEKDQAIKIPLNINGAESHLGHTLGFCTMHYLPAIAM